MGWLWQDYTREHVTAENLYAVLLGDKKAVKGGSGKVVDSKPNDRIFLYYSDHGGPGVLGEFDTVSINSFHILDTAYIWVPKRCGKSWEVI